MVRVDVKSANAGPGGTGISQESARSSAVDLRQRLDDLTRLVSDWIWETDADLNVTFVSDRVLDVLGHHPSAFQGRPLIKIVTLTRARGAVRKLTSRTPFRNVPCEVIAQDGAPRHFLLSGTPVFCLESGEFLGYRGTAEDVTERRAAEQALRLRNAVLEAISRAATVLLAAADWRPEMPDVVARLGEASGTHGLHLFEAVTDAAGDAVAVNRFHWCHPRVNKSRPRPLHRDMPLRAFGFGGWEQRLREGAVVAAETDALSADEQTFLSGEAVHSVLAVPVFAGDQWWGFLRFDRLSPSPPWADVEIEALRAAAGIIGAAVHRGRSAHNLRASEARFATAFHTSPDAIVINRVSDGVVLEVNEGFSGLTGYSRGEVIGWPVTDLGLWNKRSWERMVMRELLTHGEVRDFESGFLNHDGDTRFGSLSARLVELNGESCVLSVVRDMTRRHQADETIRKLSQAVEQSPALVMITDTRGTIEYVNPKFVDVTGYARHEMLGQTPAFLTSAQTSDEDRRAIADAVRTGQSWRGEVCNLKKDGENFWVAQSISPIRAPGGEITHFLSVSEDVTARRLFEERLHHQANHDQLTDLPNRTLFFDRLTRSLAMSRRDDWSLTLMFIDLDGFRHINDGLGPGGGDEVLRQVAGRLANWIDPADTVARLASDEFAVLLTEGSDRYHATAVVPEILHILAEPFVVDGQEVLVHASIGIAVFPEDGGDEFTLLKNADAAMIRAKELGGNTFQFFESGMNAKAAEYISLGQDLRHALQRDQFDLHYQPVVDLRSGHVVGAEALLRWHHPERGFIPPDDFIGLAEESGLIEAIGEWVLRRACRQNRTWRDQGFDSLRIAVNVSSRQLQRGRLISTVFSALSEAGLPPDSLGIEITESAFLADLEQTTETLRKLNTMGIAISVDDFGTGYSSLGYLRRLPLSTLKIDRSFVFDVTTSPDAAAIADTIIAMAHRLNLNVVAEGVEEEAQLRFLRERGCEMMQGYYFSKPVPADEFTEILRDGRRLALPRGPAIPSRRPRLRQGPATPTHQRPD